MKQILLAGLALAMVLSASAQDKKAMKYAKTITTADLTQYLSVLASDSLEGRETGEKGQKLAAAYIAGKFKSFGLEAPVPTANGNSYFQEFPLKKLSHRTTYLKKGDEIKKNNEDFLYYSRAETSGEEYIDVVFSGKKSIDDLTKMDLKGKYVAIVNEELGNWRTALAKLKTMNAAGIILIEEDEARFKSIIARLGGSFNSPKLTLEVDNNVSRIMIGNPSLASWMFGTDYEQLKSAGTGRVAKVIFNSDYLVEDIMVENVLGFIRGSEKPEEVLIVTAHYDHIGISPNGEINNGADDDGSGTTAVLEIAQAFAMAARDGVLPKRSILFMTVSGEEKGLLGSEYYSNHPVFPIANSVTDLNADMVGRVDPEHEGKGDYIYLIGSDKLSKELHEISEKVNQTYTKIALDYTYNAENDPNRYYYRSDHYNFASKGIPVIFYFNGSHADYHKPTDTIEKINFKMMQKRAQLIFYTAWELANRENRVKLD